MRTNMEWSFTEINSIIVYLQCMEICDALLTYIRSRLIDFQLHKEHYSSIIYNILCLPTPPPRNIFNWNWACWGGILIELIYMVQYFYPIPIFIVPFFLSCVGHVGPQNVAVVMFKTHYGVVLLFVCVFFFWKFHPYMHLFSFEAFQEGLIL